MITIETLRNEIIGGETTIETPYGERLLTYADYTASGKSLKFIEKYMLKLQEYYANSHTEESMTGKTMTELLHASERKIKKCFNALEDDYIIPVGTGATGAIQKLASILGIYYSPKLKEKIEKYYQNRVSKSCENDCTDKFFKKLDIEKPVVFISPYEHHSNDLIWRESFAEVVEISLTSDGEIDLADLKRKVSNPKYDHKLKIGSISAASNVTGIISPVYEIAEILHEHNAYACFDFAASAPYVEINMNKSEKAYFDAVYISPHKFIGGPGSSGLLVLNKDVYDKDSAPTVAGGGTVDYVSSSGYDFVDDVEAREMAGTPGILQIIKAALAIELKEAISLDVINEIEHSYIESVFERLTKNPKIEILGPQDPSKRIGIMSFNIKHGEGYLHHKYVTKILNDVFGIQSRAGCACAGPYGHRLLKVDDFTSNRYRNVVKEGYNSLKPGWVRVNFHYVMTEAEVQFICDALEFIAEYGYLFIGDYNMNIKSGLWAHRSYKENNSIVENFGIMESMKRKDEAVFEEATLDKPKLYKKYMSSAIETAETLKSSFDGKFSSFENKEFDELRWYPFSKTF